MSETTRHQSDLDDSLGRLQDELGAERRAAEQTARQWLAVSARAAGMVVSGETAADAIRNLAEAGKEGGV